MIRKIKSHLAFILTVLFTLLFFSNDFGLIDIQKTAIVVALGVDKQDEAYEVTAQIAIPQATDASAANNDAMVSGKGRTIAEAIDRIGLQTGWYVKLIFCNLVVLGEETLDGDVMKEMDFFLRSDKIQGTCLLAASEGKAKDLLGAVSPLDQISSFALQKILLKDANRTSEIAAVNIKDFSIGYYSRSKTSYMPFIRKKPTEQKGQDSGSSQGQGGGGGGQGSLRPRPERGPLYAEGGGSGNAGGGGSSSGGGENYVFDASETLVFYEGKYRCKLDLSETRAFNFVSKKVAEAVIELKDTDYEGKKTDVLLALEKNTYSARLAFENGAPVFKIKLSVRATIVNLNAISDLSDIATSDIVPDTVLEKAEAVISETYESAITKLNGSGCDLFRLKEKLYRHYPRKYVMYESMVPGGARLDADINVTSTK